MRLDRRCTDERTYSGGARVRVPNNSEPEAREASVGRTYASAHDRRYNDERTYSGGARVRVPNNSEPEAREASVGRTYASAPKSSNILKTRADIEKFHR